VLQSLEMQEITLEVNLKTIPPVIKRRRQVLIVLKNAEGNYILGHKNHYPPGVSRFVGGGMEEGEEPLHAAVRELHEETGILADENHLRPLRKVVVVATTPDQLQTHFEVYLFAYQLNDETLKASDDLDNVVELTPDLTTKLIDTFDNLNADIHPALNFSWQDYGKVYGHIHQLGFELTQKN